MEVTDFLGAGQVVLASAGFRARASLIINYSNE